MEAQLRVERVPLDSIQPDPANVRLHGERNLEAIQGSLARFGQQKPIVVPEMDDLTIRAIALGASVTCAHSAGGYAVLDQPPRPRRAPWGHVRLHGERNLSVQ